MIYQEFHYTIDTEIIPTIGTEVIQIIVMNNLTVDHEIIQTIDQITKDLFTTIIQMDHEKNHNIGTQTITIDKETTLNHLIEITHVIQILKTNIELIQKHQRQINQVQTTDETNSDPPETTELKINHINYESTDSESVIENTLLVNLIKDENDYETVT